MTKLVKRITAAAVAGVTAMSLAVSASAANTCKHSSYTSRRVNQVSSFTGASHEVRYFDTKCGQWLTSICHYDGVTYALANICNSCNKILSSAGYETEEYHSGPHCSSPQIHKSN